ncbi:MAG: PTS glucose transporter subunit IIA [Oligoflexia bacterium]|nr:PTS glucose transporter subunit IIA [Oligoflexia bacterium]
MFVIFITFNKCLFTRKKSYFAGDPTAGRFMASEFPIMLFGLPAATLAMYLRAKATKRKAIAGIMLSAALTSIITGITEPIEFSFIFVAPILYIFHVCAAFLSGFLTNLFDIHLGYTFSASIIDFIVGFFNQKNGLMLFAVVGPIMFALYFTVFYWLIGAMDIKTPGREDEDDDNGSEDGSSGEGRRSISVQPVSASDKAREVLAALGGAKNIRALDACITRLRLTVANIDNVNKARLKGLGAAGIMDAGGGNLQVIFGVESDMLKDQIQSLMKQDLSSVASVTSVGTSVGKNVGTNVGSITINSPMNGEIISVDSIPDQTFADKILGDGFAVIPSNGEVYAPMDGKIVQMFRTGHALGMVSKDGIELLIHVGIDTVKMEGRGFKALVKEGENVLAGTKLIEFDLALISKEAKSIISPVVITNMDVIKSLEIVANAKGKKVNQGSTVLKINLK